MIINWHKVWSEAHVPKDRRLLLITQPTNVTPDGGLLDTYDVVVGHWNKHRGGFMPVLVPLQTKDRPLLKVAHWAELPIPEEVKLRAIEEMA